MQSPSLLDNPTPAVNIHRQWHGLGHWNFYFLAKVILYWANYINFDALYNATLAAALLIPLKHDWQRRLRRVVAVPAAVALLYYDSWLPPFSRLMAQPEIFQFTFWYLLELTGRLVDWRLFAVALVAWVVYLYLSQWLRLTTLSVLALVYLTFSNLIALPNLSAAQPRANTGLSAGAPSVDTNMDPLLASPNVKQANAIAARADSGPPTNELLTEQLQAFYTEEQTRKVDFPTESNAAPFDIVFLSICSLAWSDLHEVGLQAHPFFQKFDILFEQFNSATSYSGPAVIRLLRAGCGQSSHAQLYEPTDEGCYLFNNLRKLGFVGEAAMNHTGEFQGFLQEVQENAGLPQPFIPTQTRPFLTGFDGSPIWNDMETLNGWWSRRLQSTDERKALFYNSITLHDGNREATTDGGGRAAPFRSRAEGLFDELNAFINELEASGRPVMLVLVPEHGAALEADRMQISGMREIPTRRITQVPVGVRFIGVHDEPPADIRISQPTSYLALSELVARAIEQDVFGERPIDWAALTNRLPITSPVAENEGSVVMEYQSEPYIRVDGRNWIRYPQ